MFGCSLHDGLTWDDVRMPECTCKAVQPWKIVSESDNLSEIEALLKKLEKEIAEFRKCQSDS
jgi:hypothetical protein